MRTFLSVPLGRGLRAGVSLSGRRARGILLSEAERKDNTALKIILYGLVFIATVYHFSR